MEDRINHGLVAENETAFANLQAELRRDQEASVKRQRLYQSLTLSALAALLGAGILAFLMYPLIWAGVAVVAIFTVWMISFASFVLSQWWAVERHPSAPVYERVADLLGPLSMTFSPVFVMATIVLFVLWPTFAAGGLIASGIMVTVSIYLASFNYFLARSANRRGLPAAR